MQVKTKLYLLLFPFVYLLSIGEGTARTVVVDNADSLLIEVTRLIDGDTLSLSSGTYIVAPELAPEGLVLATLDWSPYKDVTIIGAGMDATVIDFSGSYGIYVYFSRNLLIKNLTITNALKNGGICVQNAEVNLENVKVMNSASIVTDLKTEAYGGAVSYDDASQFSYIRGCVFANNSAANSGGALAFLNTTKRSSSEAYIENCQFYGNSSFVEGAAIYLKEMDTHIHLNRNVVFNNFTTSAIFVNTKNTSSARLYLKNNTVALNANGGMLVGNGLKTQIYLDNNAIVDNANFDIKGAATAYRGSFNVTRNIPNNSLIGYFNEVLAVTGVLFKVENDSLKHTLSAANYLVGRIPANAISDHDLYGSVCLAPADIGAINFPYINDVAVWTGAINHDFFNDDNWRDGVMPTGGRVSSQVQKVIISNCELSNYAEIENSVTLLNGGDLSATDIRVTPTGIFMNKGEISLDTLYVESQNGGTGQFLSLGTIANTKRLSEAYFVAQKWTPIYIPDTNMSVDELFLNAVYGIDYEIQSFDEEMASLVDVAAVNRFDQNRGYWVKNKYNRRAIFESSNNSHEIFSVQYTKQLDSLASGWNLIANPYGVAVETEELLKDNAESVAGAVYTYNGSHYKVWVDGVGDAEASVIAPREAFYVKALDPNRDAAIDFVFDNKTTLLVPNKLLKNSEVQREGMLTIGLSADNNNIYDRTFLRYKNGASKTFDYEYDAEKLDRLKGVSSSLIGTKSNAETSIDYAVNTRALLANEIQSIPIVLDFLSSTIGEQKKCKLHFSLLEGDSIAYLLHDALKDSSESLELKDSEIVSFITGTDAMALQNRFSLQVFDGEIPSRFTHLSSSKTLDTLVTVTYSLDTVVTETIEKSLVLEKKDVSFGIDSIIAITMVDSIYADSTIMTMTYTDSVFFDTTFVDTTWLWGTYEFVEQAFLPSTRSRASVKEKIILDTTIVYSRNYTVYDTVEVTGLALNDYSSDINVYSQGDCIHVQSNSGCSMDIKVFDMTGTVVANANPIAKGTININRQGIFIVKVLYQDKVMSKKVTVRY